MSEAINSIELNERTSIVMNFAFVLLITCSPLYYAKIGSYNVYQVLSVFLVIGILITMIRIHPCLIAVEKYAFFYFLIIIQVILTNIIQGNNWLQASKTILTTFVIMILPVKERTTRIVIPAMALSGAVTGLIMLGQGSYYDGFRMTLTVGGVPQDPNWVPLLFVITFAFGIFQIRNRRIPFFIRIILLFLSLLSVYETILTGSRGALFGLIVLFMVWLINEMRVSLIRCIIVFSVLFLIYFLFVNYFSNNLSTSIIERLTHVREDSRLVIWKNLISSYFDGNPIQLIFGRGDGSCVKYLNIGAHNDFLEALYEFGLLGLILQILHWYYLLKFMREKNMMCYAVLLCLLIESMFSPIHTIVYFVMPIACVVCSTKNVMSCQSKAFRVKI